MRYRVMQTIRGLSYPSDFQLYVTKLQRSGRADVPTLEQARRDYSAIRHPESVYMA